MSFYVNAGTRKMPQRGTSEYPFGSLEQAVSAMYDHIHNSSDFVQGDELQPVSIFISSNMYIEEALLLTVPVRIHGVGNPTLTFGENAGFIVQEAFLEINGCSIKRTEQFTEPRTVPILYGMRSTIMLNRVSIDVEEGGDTVILRESRLFCTDSHFTSVQTAQATLMHIDKGSLWAVRSTFSAKGLMALCFDFSNTYCYLSQTHCILLPRYTGRVASLIDSEFQAYDLYCSYASPLFNAIDAAIIADTSSVVDVQEPQKRNGFLQTVIRK